MKNELIQNLDKLHTTELGKIRIQRNLELDIDDVVSWCKSIIPFSSNIERKGKNRYVKTDDYIITINTYSYTVITAHKID